MDSSEDIKRLLGEIRDVQREHLAEYQRVAQQALDLQTRAVARQEQFSRIYKGALVAGTVLVVAVLAMIMYVLRLL
ncbi:MAG TPA: hypothetical protein VKP65_18540 [Rhodothermales bacterium]|nr:hypothetical protein [Rhodothermales bacterium]